MKTTIAALSVCFAVFQLGAAEPAATAIRLAARPCNSRFER